jgi:hypothetical protein
MSLDRLIEAKIEVDGFSRMESDRHNEVATTGIASMATEKGVDPEALRYGVETDVLPTIFNGYFYGNVRPEHGYYDEFNVAGMAKSLIRATIDMKRVKTD